MIKFSSDTLQRCEETVAQYPNKAAALLPTLWLAQEEFGYLSPESMEYVASLLELPPAHVYAVASFYTMFHLQPVGKHLIQVCRTLPCTLGGADGLLQYLTNKLGIGEGETTPDQKFTLVTTECLGSCGTAPVLQLNDDYHEQLTPSAVEALLEALP